MRKINFGCRGVFVLPFEGVEVVGRRKYRSRKAVPEFTSDREERQKVLVHSCIRGLDSIGVSLCRKTYSEAMGGGEACS